ncbi:hypothetical protein [Natranaeroarchaeum sulfidigenes]|uniref:Putative membrane protein n=1 Tax=Natranaeroarchaeum sulfidigenes TaxID=2784880 RepID=A0A897MWB7_9EURY|nr:hypothetical protein [Natranaeroarchaeum sulfidigenes]QSG02595.1 putative membrane protein [Natranaeroarchaeum sulfidigenes]
MSQSTSDPIRGELARNQQTTHDWSLSRYDVVLILIPAVFLLAALFGSLGSIPLNLALFGAALIGAAAVIDGVFWNPPMSQ